jgi:nucleoside-diphosphate-sugar epimerase
MPAIGKPFAVEMDGTSPAALSSADDVAALTRILVKTPSSPHPVYNVATQPTTMLQIAAAIKKFIPEAKIKFGHQAPPPAEAMKNGLPGKVDMNRAKQDLGFEVMPLEEAVLIHINDARLEAGLEPITK